ncbi:MAG: hypothetical protein ABFC77_05650 [Thermoguttaceae bacterium]
MVTRRRFLQTVTSMAALAVPCPSFASNSKGKVRERKSKATLTPFGLNHDETMRFLLRDGKAWELKLLGTSAEITQRKGARITAYAFDCDVQINGTSRHLRREVGTQASFYEPWEIDGVRLWFDAVPCIFKDAGGFMLEKDWNVGFLCKPDHKARFVVQEAGMPICPEPVQLWYPNDAGRIDIRQCYNGDDCWMGPYNGAEAHCGLDINMKAGTVLSAPISVDDHYLFHSTAAGFNNNRWRGIRRWPDGSEWWLQAHHLIQMLVPERTPLKAGTPYATTAGVRVGSHQHTHFMFRVIDQGGDYLLDPWILFWEAFRQRHS